MKKKIYFLLNNLSKTISIIIKLFFNHHYLKQSKILKLNLIKSN